MANIQMKKKHKKKLSLKKELNLYKRHFAILVILYLVTLGVIINNQFFDKQRIVFKDIQFENITENYKVAYARPMKVEQTKVILDNTLTKDEAQRALDWISDGNPLYFNYQRRITITNDICKYYGLLEECKQGLRGYNNRGGEIYVTFLEDELEFKEILCHELMHTFVYPTSSDAPAEDGVHAIVYSLGIQQVCFNEAADYYSNPNHYLTIEDNSQTEK